MTPPSPATADPTGGSTGVEGLRRANAALLMRALRDGGPASRSELAGRTGLAKATVGTIVGELVRSGVLAEEPVRPSGGRGRPRVPVGLAGRDLLALGLEVNVDYVSAVVLDLVGDVRCTHTRAVGDDGPTAALADLAREVGVEVAGSVLVGATVALPGLVDTDDRTPTWVPNVPLDGVDLAATVEHALEGRCRVRVGNDANLAALAELRRGAAVGVPDAFYLTGTVGIGAGVLVGGTLLRGGSGYAGEVGHLPLGAPDARCGCGRLGCWEASIGLQAVQRLAGLTDDESRHGTPVEQAAAVARRAADDPALRHGLAEVGRALGAGLATLVTVLDPTVVVLGGYFPVLADLLEEPARRELDARLPSPTQPRPEIRSSALGLAAAAFGGAEQALDPIFTGGLAVLEIGRTTSPSGPGAEEETT